MKSQARQPADPIQAMFNTHRLRCTPQRRALYETLSATTLHPTADQLYQQVSRSDQSISLATVYNTLEAFCRAGLAQKLAAKGGSTRYDATLHNHLHIRDEKTGLVADVPDELGRKVLEHIPAHLIEELETRLGFKINQLQIELVGEGIAKSDKATNA